MLLPLLRGALVRPGAMPAAFGGDSFFTASDFFSTTDGLGFAPVASWEAHEARRRQRMKDSRMV